MLFYLVKVSTFFRLDTIPKRSGRLRRLFKLSSRMVFHLTFGQMRQAWNACLVQNSPAFLSLPMQTLNVYLLKTSKGSFETGSYWYMGTHWITSTDGTSRASARSLTSMKG